MRKIVLLVIVFMLLSALVAFGGKEGARSIQEVVEQHHNKVGASIKDVEDIVADYADDAIFIMPDKNLVGKEAIEVAFMDFFKAFPNLRFTETQIRIEDDMVLIMWNGECDTGTIPHAIDTFIISDDKIQRQTCWLTFVPKGAVAEVGVEHMVLLKLKPDATQEQIEALTTALLSIADEVPGIVEINAGVNSSIEGQDKGYEYGLLVRFTDAAARDAYVTDPYHLSIVGEYAVPILEDLIIVDFEH